MFRPDQLMIGMACVVAIGGIIQSLYGFYCAMARPQTNAKAKPDPRKIAAEVAYAQHRAEFDKAWSVAKEVKKGLGKGMRREYPRAQMVYFPARPDVPADVAETVNRLMMDTYRCNGEGYDELCEDKVRDALVKAILDERARHEAEIKETGSFACMMDCAA